MPFTYPSDSGHARRFATPPNHVAVIATASL